MPHENPDEYAALVRSWTETLRPASAAEGHLVARIADVGWRLERLSRMEHTAILDEADRLVKEGALAKSLVAFREARDMMAGLASMASQTRLSNRPMGSVTKMMDTIRLLVQRVLDLGHVTAEVSLLNGKILELGLGELTGEEDLVWAAAGELAQKIADQMSAKVTEMEKAVEAQKKDILERIALGDEGQLRRLRRHRLALQKEQDASIATLKKLRELTSLPEPAPSERGLVAVELRLLTITKRTGS